jgi:phosphatidylethanolamine/phosphatidyl-N-methylethanolamine N-methyltransferase
MLSRERRLFFLRWLRNPRSVGAVLPSSSGLGNAMAAQLSELHVDEYVLELGPGTGPVTRALCRAGVRQDRLVIIEREHAFIEKLKHDFPEALVLEGDARDLISMLHAHNVRQVAAVVSSLPLLSIPKAIRDVVVHEAFKALKPNGVFIQFTYGLLSPVPRHLQRDVGIRGKIAKHIWRNFPPARVWRYQVEA